MAEHFSVFFVSYLFFIFGFIFVFHICLQIAQIGCRRLRWRWPSRRDQWLPRAVREGATLFGGALIFSFYICFIFFISQVFSFHIFPNRRCCWIVCVVSVVLILFAGLVYWKFFSEPEPPRYAPPPGGPPGGGYGGYPLHVILPLRMSTSVFMLLDKLLSVMSQR